MSGRFVTSIAAAIIIFTGCAPQIKKPMLVCPGKKLAADSLSILRSRPQNTVPLKANGQCLLQYYAEGKEHKENFPVKLWVNPVGSPRQQGADVGRLTFNRVNPPAQIYLQGDIAFDPKGLVIGSNEREFWLAIKLKEISSYWWGQWSEGSCLEGLMISPKAMLEALGFAAIDSDESSREGWSLSNEGAFDVLTRRNRQGAKSKKIFIYSCDYLIRRIEYFDANGKAMVVTELDKYKQVADGFFVPAVIKIITLAEDSSEDSVSITLSLKSMKSAHFTEKAQSRLFTRPEPQGFRHIYRVIDGEIIEE